MNGNTPDWLSPATEGRFVLNRPFLFSGFSRSEAGFFRARGYLCAYDGY